MKKHINTIKDLIIRRKILSVVILLVVLFVLYQIFGGAGVKQESLVVKRGDITQKVIVNGNTKPVNEVQLGFQVNGTVSKAYVSVGTRVTTGQSLVALDSSELNAQYLKAQANLASEKARLDELKKGTRPEEIAVSETSVLNAKTSLVDAQRNIKNKVIDAVTNDVDQLFSNPHTSSPTFNLITTSSQLRSDIISGRVELEGIINSWTLDISNENLTKIKIFLDNVALAVNKETSSSAISQASLDIYRASISSARSSVITAEGSLNDAKSALTLAEKNLALKKSGSAPEAISSQEAKVLQADADLQNVFAQLSKTSLKSPQNGVVTKQEAKVGEVVTPGKVIVSIISDSDLEIESNVSEVSIGKVNIGNMAEIRFDAFPGEVFKGQVSYIEPGETIIDGVVNYKVTVAFSEKYTQIKSGLTSKLDIITGIKTDVLSVPQYALITKEDGIYVSKKVGDKSEEVKVEVGLRGQDGSVEILSGLSEGETIEYLPSI